MNLTEATILALQGKLLKEEKEVKKEAIDIISNDTVVSVDDDKTEVITDEAVVTVQDTKEALEDNKEEETPVEEVLPEEPVEEIIEDEKEETTEEETGDKEEEVEVVSEDEEEIKEEEIEEEPEEEKVEESMASDAADEIAHDDRYYNAGTGNIDVFLAREVADIAETLGDDYSEWLDKESIKEIIAELKEEDYLWEPLAQATREKIEDKVDWIRKDDPASRYYDGDLSELEEGCLKTEKCNKEDKKHSIKVKVTERKLEEGSTIQVIEEYSAEDLDDQLWSGARDRWVDFTDDQKEMLIDIFNDAYAAATTIEEMPSLVTFNDFIWFDSDSYIENEEEDLEESKKVEGDLSKDLFGAEAERRLSQEQKDLEKDLQYCRDILAGKEVIDDKYHEKLDLERAKKWLRKDFVNVNCLASADPEEIDKKLAKEYPDIFGKELKTKSEKELEENKKIEEDKLEPVYDSAASFYGKAETDGDKLYSYNTLVAEMIDGKPVVYNLQSLTTTRHVREWLKQNGFEATTKKQIAKDYGAEDIIL